jgi:hypothetical protein
MAGAAAPAKKKNDVWPGTIIVVASDAVDAKMRHQQEAVEHLGATADDAGTELAAVGRRWLRRSSPAPSTKK